MADLEEAAKWFKCSAQRARQRGSNPKVQGIVRFTRCLVRPSHPTKKARSSWDTGPCAISVRSGRVSGAQGIQALRLRRGIVRASLWPTTWYRAIAEHGRLVRLQ
jgi:hypothetical protein